MEASPRWGVPKASDLSLLARNRAESLLQRVSATIERTDNPAGLTSPKPCKSMVSGFSFTSHETSKKPKKEAKNGYNGSQTVVRKA